MQPFARAPKPVRQRKKERKRKGEGRAKARVLRGRKVKGLLTTNPSAPRQGRGGGAGESKRTKAPPTQKQLARTKLATTPPTPHVHLEVRRIAGGGYRR